MTHRLCFSGIFRVWAPSAGPGSRRAWWDAGRVRGWINSGRFCSCCIYFGTHTLHACALGPRTSPARASVPWLRAGQSALLLHIELPCPVGVCCVRLAVSLRVHPAPWPRTAKIQTDNLMWPARRPTPSTWLVVDTTSSHWKSYGGKVAWAWSKRHK